MDMTEDDFRLREPPSLLRPFLGNDPGAADGRGDPGAPLLRPYLLTSGRVQPIDHTLEIEAQVMTTDYGWSSYSRLSFEHRDIIGLCTSSMSVAEVAARLRMHIGVAKVIVADLAALGCLIVERPTAEPADDPDMIERVIRGLEAIR
jgi:hypothetical protein